MSNGQAERFVDTFKRTLVKQKGEGTLSENLQSFLQNYRSTPNQNTPENKSPSEILFGRKMRIPLDLIKPTFTDSTPQKPLIKNETMEKQLNIKHGARDRYFSEGDAVYARMYAGNNNFCWKPGQVVERIGNVIYNVLLHDAKLIRAHVNQLRKIIAWILIPTLIPIGTWR